MSRVPPRIGLAGNHSKTILVKAEMAALVIEAAVLKAAVVKAAVKAPGVYASVASLCGYHLVQGFA